MEDLNEDGLIDEKEAEAQGMTEQEFDQADINDDNAIDPQEANLYQTPSETTRGIIPGDYLKADMDPAKQETNQGQTLRTDPKQLRSNSEILSNLLKGSGIEEEVPRTDVNQMEENSKQIDQALRPYYNDVSPLPDEPIEEEPQKEEESKEFSLPKVNADLSSGSISVSKGGGMDGINSFIPAETSVTFDDAKKILQSLGGGEATSVAGAGTLSGVSEDDFNPETENPVYSSQGKDFTLPDAGAASSSSTLSTFNNILNGSYSKATKGDPVSSHTSGESRFQSSLASKGKKTEKQPQKQGLKLPAKQSVYDRIVNKVKANCLSWPEENGERVKEKGSVAVYSDGKDIDVKYGSYRKQSLEAFAESKPSFLPQILEAVI